MLYSNFFNVKPWFELTSFYLLNKVVCNKYEQWQIKNKKQVEKYCHKQAYCF